MGYLVVTGVLVVSFGRPAIAASLIAAAASLLRRGRYVHEVEAEPAAAALRGARLKSADA